MRCGLLASSPQYVGPHSWEGERGEERGGGEGGGERGEE